MYTLAVRVLSGKPLLCNSVVLFDPPALQAIVAGIRDNNPGRPIPASQVRGFASRDAANAYEKANPETVTGGLFFSRQSGGNIGFVLQSNSTVGSLALAPFLRPPSAAVAGLVASAIRQLDSSIRAGSADCTGEAHSQNSWHVDVALCRRCLATADASNGADVAWRAFRLPTGCPTRLLGKMTKQCASRLQALNFHGVYLDPNLEIQVPLQVAAEREIARSYFAATSGRTLAAADWNVNITDFAHPPVRAPAVQ